MLYAPQCRVTSGPRRLRSARTKSDSHSGCDPSVPSLSRPSVNRRRWIAQGTCTSCHCFASINSNQWLWPRNQKVFECASSPVGPCSCWHISLACTNTLNCVVCTLGTFSDSLQKLLVLFSGGIFKKNAIVPRVRGPLKERDEACGLNRQPAHPLFIVPEAIILALWSDLSSICGQTRAWKRHINNSVKTKKWRLVGGPSSRGSNTRPSSELYSNQLP